MKDTDSFNCDITGILQGRQDSALCAGYFWCLLFRLICGDLRVEAFTHCECETRWMRPWAKRRECKCNFRGCRHVCGTESDKRNPEVCFELAGLNFLCHILPHTLLWLKPFFTLCLDLSPFFSLSLSLFAAFGTWSGRVRFKSSEPTVDSSLVIMGTEVSDKGTYICHISTFPSGNFDREMSLIVWSESLPHGSVGKH